MFTWFANLRLRWKVLFAPALLILVLIGVGTYFSQMQRSNQAAVDALMVGPVRQAETVADFTTTAWKAQVRLYHLMATAANETDEKKIKALAGDAAKALGEMAEKSKTLEDSAFNNGKTGEKLGQLKTAVTNYIKQAKSVIDMADGDAGTALTLMMGATRSFTTIANLTDDLTDSSKDLRDREIAINNAALDRQTSLLITVMVIMIVVGCAASLLISRGISRPVMGISNAIKRMAAGDFDMVLPGLGRKDEIGEIAAAVEGIKAMATEKARIEAEQAAVRQAHEAEEFARQQKAEAEILAKAAEERAKAAEEQARVLDLLASGLKRLSDGDLTFRLTDGFTETYRQIKDDFNNTVAGLQETIGAIAASTREVTNASAEISTSTTDLSQRTEEQAASLEQTSASMEEISATVKKNAENAQQANASAGTTREVADRGGQVVAKAVDAMAKIEDSSRKISDIIGVIDEIARQTNLLALNAAVEAARAGEAGRGFAVVASEVRSLAQRSSQAAKDIKDLITNSNGQVKDGVDLVNRAGTALTEIVESIKKVAEIVADIANASGEQASGIEQVNKALTQMDEVTQQNSALVEENAATAKTLEHQAKAMDERVGFFKLDGGSEGGQPAPAREQRPLAAAPSRGPAAPKKQQVAAHKRAAAGGNSGGPVGRMQAALATAVKADPDWKEF
jgi:methyl-accepting chemotaxis protein